MISLCHIIGVNAKSRVAGKRNLPEKHLVSKTIPSSLHHFRKKCKWGKHQLEKWTGMYCVCRMGGVWCHCVFQCVGVRSSYSFLNGGWTVLACVGEGSRSCRETNLGALCRVFRWTRLTDTTWCPSSRLPTPSRTPHTTSPRPRAPSWARSSNTVRPSCVCV